MLYVWVGNNALMGKQRDDPDMSDETRGQEGLGGVRGRDWEKKHLGMMRDTK